MVGKRDMTIDFLKGICIILMVVGHSGAPKWLHDIIYTFHMPVFFIISGFLFKPKYILEWKVFLKRKLIAIYWPFLLWTTIYIVIHNLFYNWEIYSNEYTTQNIKEQLVQGALMLKTEQLLGGFWFLQALLFASVFSVIFLKIFGLSRKSIILGILILVGGAFSMSYFSLSKLYFNPVNFLSSGFFMFGILINNIIISKRYTYSLLVASIIFIAVEVGYFPVSILTCDYLTIVPYFLIASCFSWSIIIICRTNGSSLSHSISKIGNRSLDILIFHFLVFKGITFLIVYYNDLPMKYMQSFPVVDISSWHWIVYSVCGIVISLLIGVAIDRLKSTIKRCVYLIKGIEG